MFPCTIIAYKMFDGNLSTKLLTEEIFDLANIYAKPHKKALIDLPKMLKARKPLEFGTNQN